VGVGGGDLKKTSRGKMAFVKRLAQLFLKKKKKGGAEK